MSSIKNEKIIVIIGPTSAGKTSLAVKLALAIGGEIISADSRQVFRYMDVGTGKDLPNYELRITNYESGYNVGSKQFANQHKFCISKRKNGVYVKIPYHLIDVVHPNTNFDLAKWIKRAKKAILDIQKRGRVPIVCGGTGLYAQALVEGFDLDVVAGADDDFRARLEEKALPELLTELRRLDIDKFSSLNQSEQGNKRRLIRYIEIAENRKLGNLKFSKDLSGEKTKADDFAIFGISWPIEALWARIHQRLLERLEREDLVGEVKRLHEKHKVSWKRLESFGLEYKFVSLYLRGKLTYAEMFDQLFIAIRQFAKRQMTWFRRWEKQGRKIHWAKEVEEILEIYRNLLK